MILMLILIAAAIVLRKQIQFIFGLAFIAIVAIIFWHMPWHWAVIRAGVTATVILVAIGFYNRRARRKR